MSELARAAEPIQLGRGRTSAAGLSLPDDTSVEEWRAVGETLKRCEGAVMWWVGDWFLFGETKWGEIYKDIAVGLGYEEGTLRDARWVAAAIGLSDRSDKLSWTHHRLVAALEPEERREWVAEAEKAGWSYAEFRQRVREGRKAAIGFVDFPEGVFSVIVCDPPWTYTNVPRSASKKFWGGPPYPMMTTEEICALPIPAAKDCIMWLWTTNAHMHEAYHVLEAWGFEPKTTLTWAKHKMGFGKWLRGKTEHCILAIKGKPKVNLTNETTLLWGKVREHSRKPDEFYELVEVLCPNGNRLEMFARQRRTGWESHGTEVGKYARQERLKL